MQERGGFVRRLLVAALVVACLVAALVLFGRPNRQEQQASPTAARPEATVPPSNVAAEHAAKNGPREALPAEAWAILDLDLGRLGQLGTPLSGRLEALDCDQIPPPRRISVALLAPPARADGGAEGGDELEFLVTSTDATAAFRACARERMLAGGAVSEPWPGGIDVASRPGGLRLLSSGDGGPMMFASAPSWGTDALVEVLAGAHPSAARHGHHAALLASMTSALAPHAPAEDARPLPPLGDSSAVLLTVALPNGWVDGLVPPEDAARTPLRFLRAAAWALQDDGLFGLIDCQVTQDGSGCEALGRFFEDARDDLLSHAPGDQRSALIDGWSLRATAPYRLELRWRIPAEARARLLTRLVAGAL